MKYNGEYVDDVRATELRSQGVEVDVVRECRTGEELHEAGFKVSVVRSAADAEGAQASAEVAVGGLDAVDEVSADVFEKWMTASQCALGQTVLAW